MRRSPFNTPVELKVSRLSERSNGILRVRPKSL
jgi:hypothetical protein